jgi:hypothetical protein
LEALNTKLEKYIAARFKLAKDKVGNMHGKNELESREK